MSVQMASRAKASIVGELLEAPTFQTSTKGDKYARIRLQTSEHFFSNGERKVTKATHNITVYHPVCVKLLETFGKPGVHFLAEGKINYEKDRMVIVVGQFGGELLVMYTGGEADSSAKSETTTSQPSSSSETPASKPSGGVGRLGKNVNGGGQPSINNRGTTSQGVTDESLDDDIPF